MPENFGELVSLLIRIILASILPLLVGLALLAFVWGLAKFIAKSSEQSIAEGKKLIVWGLIALFILFSFWAIIAFVYNDLGFARPFGFPILPTS